MSESSMTLKQALTQELANWDHEIIDSYNELTVVINPQDVVAVAQRCRDADSLAFDMLIDISGVDYLHYRLSEWRTDTAANTSYERGVEWLTADDRSDVMPERFGVVYHLLSIGHNQRVRLKTFVPEDSPIVGSVVNVWPAANWFEREAFDLFGLLFENHPDLRRILTDYGFIGHPFRKDFPLSGEVEVRYDANSERVIYESLNIEPRVLMPKVVREDNRYINRPTQAPGEQDEEQQ